WLSLEVALSLLRITLWGWNPKWDDTMMHLEITLTDEQPLVTTPQDWNGLQRITDDQAFTESFFVQEQSQFLGSITGFTGPFQPFNSETVDLYYALVGQADPEHKFLITIIRNLRNGSLIALVHRLRAVHDLNTYKPLSVTWNQLSGMNDAMQVTLGEVLYFVYHPNSAILVGQIHHHSVKLAQRLAGYRRIQKLDLSWKLTTADNHFHTKDYPSLSKDDKAYMEILPLQQRLYNFLRYRDSALEDHYSIVAELEPKMHARYRLEEMALMEMLCVAESYLLELGPSTASNMIRKSLVQRHNILGWTSLPEYVRDIRDRMAEQKKAFIERWKVLKPNDDESIAWWSDLATNISTNWSHMEIQLYKRFGFQSTRYDEAIKKELHSLAKHPHFCSLVYLLIRLGMKGYFPQPKTSSSRTRIVNAIQCMVERVMAHFDDHEYEPDEDNTRQAKFLRRQPIRHAGVNSEEQTGHSWATEGITAVGSPDNTFGMHIMGSSFRDSSLQIRVINPSISQAWGSPSMSINRYNCHIYFISGDEMGQIITDNIQPLSGVCRCGTAVPHFEMRPLRRVSDSRDFWWAAKVIFFFQLRRRITSTTRIRMAEDHVQSLDMREQLSQEFIILVSMNISESYIAELVLCSQGRVSALDLGLAAGPQHQISMLGWQSRWKLESEEMSDSLMHLGILDHARASIMAEYIRLEQIYMQIQSYDAAEGVLAGINARFGTVATDSAPLFLDSLGFTCHRQSGIVLSAKSQEHVDREFLRSMRRIRTFVDIHLLEDE
ncbi:hypothetical protein C8J56DRAFT_972491, partial [Mycena floridula]